jgi:hypothetical protein
MLLLSGCSNNNSTVQADSAYSSEADLAGIQQPPAKAAAETRPEQQSESQHEPRHEQQHESQHEIKHEPRPQQQSGIQPEHQHETQPGLQHEQQPELLHGPQPLASQPIFSPVKQAPGPFPDDGKTPAWRQSARFPDYAYDNSDLPRQLYTYSFNQGITRSHKMLVKPVDFYCQTSPAVRSELLEFFKDLVSSYYTVDFSDTGTWENNMRKFFDPKVPVTTVNGLHPETFILQATNNTVNNRLTVTLSEILTDESLIYLDDNAHYRVRGRITLQVTASASPQLPAGTHTYDVEVAFKKKLLSGPDDWAAKDYVVTALVTLH